jgi:hypothetical protein
MLARIAAALLLVYSSGNPAAADTGRSRTQAYIE